MTNTSIQHNNYIVYLFKDVNIQISTLLTAEFKKIKNMSANKDSTIEYLNVLLTTINQVMTHTIGILESTYTSTNEIDFSLPMYVNTFDTVYSFYQHTKSTRIKKALTTFIQKAIPTAVICKIDNLTDIMGYAKEIDSSNIKAPYIGMNLKISKLLNVELENHLAKMLIYVKEYTKERFLSIGHESKVLYNIFDVINKDLIEITNFDLGAILLSLDTYDRASLKQIQLEEKFEIAINKILNSKEHKILFNVINDMLPEMLFMEKYHYIKRLQKTHMRSPNITPIEFI